MKLADRLYHVLTSVIAIVVTILVSAAVHAEVEPVYIEQPETSFLGTR